MNDKPLGLIKDMTAEEYHSIDAFSASGMRELARSAWHYRNRVPMAPTRPMLNGTLAHCAILEPGALSERYIVVPESAPRRPTKAQWGAKNPSPESKLSMEWWAGFEKSCGSRLIVAADDYIVTQAQIAAIQAEPEVAELFSTGYAEASVFWVDEATGVYCKARPDWVHPTGPRTVKLVDLKAMADDTPEGFSRGAARLGYHRQRAHYLAGFQAATGLTVEAFPFVVVSSVPPVLAVAYGLVDEVIQQGEQECSELLAYYAECREHNRWPAYAPADRMIDFPKWAKRSQELEVSYVD